MASAGRGEEWENCVDVLSDLLGSPIEDDVRACSEGGIVVDEADEKIHMFCSNVVKFHCVGNNFCSLPCAWAILQRHGLALCSSAPAAVHDVHHLGLQYPNTHVALESS